MSPPLPDNSGPSKRDAIIDVAARSFAERGFHGVSMRDIAKLNNSSVATLYNHFTSKDALMLGVGQRFFDPCVQRLRDASKEPVPGLTRVLTMIDIAFAEGCLHRNEFLAIAQGRRHIAATAELAPLVAARSECTDLWTHVLEAGIEDGSIRADIDTTAVVWVVFSALTGILDVNMQAEFAGADPTPPLLSLRVLLDSGLRP